MNDEQPFDETEFIKAAIPAMRSGSGGFKSLLLQGIPKFLPLSSSPERAKIKLPERYVAYHSMEEIDETLIDSLVDTYVKVFGDDEIDKNTGEVIWGEGWKCMNCGKTIPLNQGNNGICESCNGELKPYYNRDELKDRFISELIPSEDIQPCLGIMYGNEDTPVGGFVECCVGSWDGISDRIFNARFKGNDSGRQELLQVEQILHERGANLENILYEDEMGTLRSDEPESNFRDVPGSFFNLARVAFEHGVYNGAKEAVFWTSTRSQVFRLASMYGFEAIHQTADGLVFLYHPDIVSLLKIQQNVSPNLIRRLAK